MPAFPALSTAEKETVAALDLGTNNCRLLLVQAEDNGDGYTAVGGYSRITRLGQGLSASGVLSEAAMDRTIDVLKHCAEVVRDSDVTRGRYVATEACRRAANCDEFLMRAENEAGVTLEIITAAEEARLALLGCSALFEQGPEHALVFDVGGGSTEIIWARLNGGRAVAVEDFVSLPMGVVTITEDHGGVVVPEDFPGIKALVKKRLDDFETRNNLNRHIANRNVQMIGTSGTITTLAGAVLDLERYDRKVVDGLWLEFSTLEGACKRLAAMTHKERATHPCIGEGRADLVVAGCAILEAVCELWPVGRLRVADRGVREGMLRELLAL